MYYEGLIIQTVKITSMLIMLLITSILDVKYREVNPKIWLPFGFIGGTLTAYESYKLLAEGYMSLLHLTLFLLISIGITSSIMFIFSYLELIGGADFLAILVLSITHPWRPYPSLITVIPFFPLSILANATLLSITPALYNMFYNLTFYNRYKETLRNVNFWKKLLIMVIGRPKSVSKYLKTKFTYLLQNFNVEDGRVSVEFKVDFKVHEDPSEDRAKVSKLIEGGILREDDMLWTTEGLPMICFILGGYLLTLTLGDVLLYLLIKLIIRF